MYSESLGRWHTADLLIGLAYLARREGQEHPVADIAGKAQPIGQGHAHIPEQGDVLEEMQQIQRFMGYCLALRERRAVGQQAVFTSLGIQKSDVLMQEPRAGVLRPSFCLVRDEQLHCIVLAIRGTHSLKDMFTSLTGTSKPHHMVDPESGVVLGYSHFGMLAAARWLLQQLAGPMKQALKDHPGYKLKVIGHSLGGGTAAMLTMMMREWPEFAEVTCLAIACPSCMTLDLARSCSTYVTTIINGADLIPTVSAGSADALREEVMQSSWYEAFRSDMRSSVVVRAVESSVGRIGAATHAATSWTSSQLASTGQGLRSCYAQRPRMLRKRSHQAFTDLEAEEEPLSPVMHPLHQEMGAGGGSDSDGDQVMGTGLPSPRGSVAKELASLGAAADPLGATASSPAPTWSKVLGSLKLWGIAPAGQSAAATPAPDRDRGSGAEPHGHGSSSQSRRQLNLSDSDTEVVEPVSRALSESEALGVPGGSRRVRTMPLGAASAQPRDRLFSSLDSNQVGSSEGGAGWGLGRMTGWGQSSGKTSKSVGERVGQSGKTAYRSFVSRWWLQDCRSDAYVPEEPGDEAEQMAADVKAVQAPAFDASPQAMEMNDKPGESGDMADGDVETPGGVPLPTPAQLNADMQSAHAAAAALDEEEEQNHGGQGSEWQRPLPDQDPGHLPDQDPGHLPDQDPGHLPGLEEALQRRTMYPAGRILHLVPARLVFSAEQLAKLDPEEEQGGDPEVYPQGTAVLLAATPPSCGPVVWPKAPSWVPPQPPPSHPSDDTAKPESSPKSQVELAGRTPALEVATSGPQTPLELAASVANAAPGHHHRSTSSAPNQDSAGAQDKRKKSASKQWIGYDSNVAEVDGSLHVFSDAAMSEEEEGDDGPRRVQEKHVLLDHVPQEAYGRIKLCSTMIQDHFIPCYSANMQTAMELYVKYSR